MKKASVQVIHTMYVKEFASFDELVNGLVSSVTIIHYCIIILTNRERLK